MDLFLSNATATSDGEKLRTEPILEYIYINQIIKLLSFCCLSMKKKNKTNVTRYLSYSHFYSTNIAYFLFYCCHSDTTVYPTRQNASKHVCNARNHKNPYLFQLPSFTPHNTDAFPAFPGVISISCS